jgi:endogenous inhibitor of DNA gyrase (YacG/DUF329 family)
MATCPICGKPAAARAENPSSPFCSARCKQVDLGQWLNEDYRIAGPPVTDDGEPHHAKKES